jgi:hypothetical protein
VCAKLSPVTLNEAIVPLPPTVSVEVTIPWSGIAFGTSRLANTAEQAGKGVALFVATGTEVFVRIGVGVNDAAGIPVAVGTCGIGVRVGLGCVL